MKITRHNELTTTAWSGGTTTQLAIYPETAVYANRDFLWRVSTARVEVQESVFTSLPNIHRIIMPIEGNLYLNHEGHGEAHLQPFEQNSFMGDWHTTSCGCVTDFNLMMADGCTGTMEALTIEPLSNIKLNVLTNNINNQNTTEIFYFLAHITLTMPDGNMLDMQHGDVLQLQSNIDKIKDIEFTNFSDMPINIIRTVIYIS